VVRACDGVHLREIVQNYSVKLGILGIRKRCPGKNVTDPCITSTVNWTLVKSGLVPTDVRMLHQGG